MKRLIWPLFLLLALAGLVARWRAPALLPWITRSVLATLALRLVSMIPEARAGKLPWTRLLLPAVFLVEGLGLAMRPSPVWNVLKPLTAAALELALIVFLVRRVAKLEPEPGVLPEEHLAKPLEAFLPPRAARIIALEFVVISGGLRFLLGGWRRPDPPGFSYHRESVLGPILLALPALMAADVLLLDILLRHFSPWIRWTVHGLDLYGLLWAVGLWASMRARPHRVEEGEVELHHGFLGHLHLRLDQIEDIEPLPAFDDDWARLRFMKGVAQLAVPGPDQLLLKIKEPVAPMGLLGPGRLRERALVAVDDAEAFRKALLQRSVSSVSTT